MTRKIYSGNTQYVASGATRTLHTGPGKIYAIIATCSSTTPAALAMYDATSVTTPVLGSYTISAYAPLIIILPKETPMLFSNGLTVAAAANVNVFIITEAEV